MSPPDLPGGLILCKIGGSETKKDVKNLREYVLGVDGGGSKTHLALFDLSGSLVDFEQTGCTNHEILPGAYEEMERVLLSAVNVLLTRNRLAAANLGSAVFGISGVDTAEQHRLITYILQRGGFSDFLLCNDSFLGIKAGSRQGVGICSINGTGCSVSGLDPSGSTVVLGGQGEYTGEPGGGRYLGFQAIRAGYRALFHMGPETALTGLLMKEFDVPSREEYIEVIRREVNLGHRKVGDLAATVFDAACDGDAVAVGILEEMGREVGLMVNGVVAGLDFDPEQPLDVILAGSINVKGRHPAARETLRDTVLAAHPGRDIRFTSLLQPPVAGAVLWALERAGMGGAFYDKVNEQLTGYAT